MSGTIIPENKSKEQNDQLSENGLDPSSKFLAKNEEVHFFSDDDAQDSMALSKGPSANDRVEGLRHKASLMSSLKITSESSALKPELRAARPLANASASISVPMKPANEQVDERADPLRAEKVAEKSKKSSKKKVVGTKNAVKNSSTVKSSSKKRSALGAPSLKADVKRVSDTTKNEQKHDSGRDASLEIAGAFASDDGLAMQPSAESVDTSHVNQCVDDGVKNAKNSKAERIERPQNSQPQSMAMEFDSIQILSVCLLGLWVAIWGIYTVQNWSVMDTTPQGVASLMAGVFAPAIMFWLVLSSFYKQGTGASHSVSEIDSKAYAEAMRDELRAVLFSSEENDGDLVNKDIEGLCQQVAELSSSSKDILKSMQRARQGLRTEIRDFSGVSKKAEFHIDRLAESLNEKTKTLNALTEEIETRTANIDAKTKEGADAWKQASLDMMEKSGEMENILLSGADKILVAADKAQEKTDAIDEKLEANNQKLQASIDRAAERLSDLNSDFSDQTDVLRNAADKISEEIGALSGVVRDQIEDFQSVADGSIDKMRDSTDMIRAQRDDLEDSAQAMAMQAGHISDMISGSVGKINLCVDEAVDKTENLDERLQAKIDQISSNVKDIGEQVNNIEEASTYASNKLGEALNVAISGSEQISSAVRRAVESLETSTNSAKEQAEDLIKVTKENVEELTLAGAGNVEQVKNIVSMLAGSKAQVEDVTKIARAHVDTLSSLIVEENEKMKIVGASLSDRVEQVRSALEDPLERVEKAIRETDGRHKQIEETLGRRIGDLNQATQKAVQGAEDIRLTLRGQAQEMSRYSSEISANAKIVTEQMGKQQDMLSCNVKEALKDLDMVTDSLEAKAFKVRDISGDAARSIDSVKVSIAEGCSDVGTFTAQAFQNLQSLDQSLDSKITLLKHQADETSGSVIRIKKSLADTAEEIEPMYMRAIDSMDDVQQRFDVLKAGFEVSTDSNLAKMKQVGVIFDERLRDLKDGSEEAALALRTSGDYLHDCVESINQATKSASQKLYDMSGTLQDQSSDLHLATDQALLKVESVQKAINEQFYELSETVGQSIAQLRQAGEEFMSQAKNVRESADDVSDDFAMAGTKARQESEFFAQAAERTVHKTQEMVEEMQQQAEVLLSQANTSLIELKKAGDSFAIRAKEVEEHMRGSLKTSESYGYELKSQANMISEASTDTAACLSKAVSVLASQVMDIGNVANDATIKVEKSRRNIGEEAERLVMVSSEVVETINHASSTFEKQSESLFKATQDAALQAKDIQSKQVREERDAFMSSAKFILESMHSLSVDLTRILDGEISEKTWKAFQKGDVGAFTRKLVQMAAHMPADKTREKFESDTEFRTYVQRYVRQFEELYDQAVENDHGALLSSTFVSSDIGKLYEFLCIAAGKEPRYSGALSRAA